MSERLHIIKDLRAKGATIRMIDDVAAHLDANGGYDSPVFIATVEFIIKIRQMLQSVLQQHAQNMMPQQEFSEKDHKETENVNFEAAKAGVSGDDEVESDEKAKILEYIETVQAQRESYVEALESKDEKKDKRKKKSGRRGNSLLEKLSRITAMLSDKNNKERSQRDQHNAELESERNDNARQNAARQQQQNAQTVQKTSLLKMNLTKMRLLSPLKMGKDKTVIGQAGWEAKKADKQMNKVAKDAQSRDGKIITAEELASLKTNPNKAQASTNKSADGRDKKTAESAMADILDKAVRAGKKRLNDQHHNHDHQHVEKGKFELQHAEKSGPRTDRADDNKVAEMAAKDAIAALKNSGVTTTSTEASNKKEMDAQLVQMQGAAGGGATPKLQR